jgi:hypothetical protein
LALITATTTGAAAYGNTSSGITLRLGALAFAQNEAVEGLVSSAEPVIQHRSAFCSGHCTRVLAGIRPT